jgi:hypothetical protein
MNEHEHITYESTTATESANEREYTQIRQQIKAAMQPHHVHPPGEQVTLDGTLNIRVHLRTDMVL